MKHSKKEALAKFHRDNILSVAEKLFLEKGVDKTTIDDIAKVADYSKSTIYVYFKSKDEIFDRIVLKGAILFRSHVEESVNSKNVFLDKYYALCWAVIEYRNQYPFYSEHVIEKLEFMTHYQERSGVAIAIIQECDALDKFLEDFWLEGVANGDLKEGFPALASVFFIWFSIYGVAKLSSIKKHYVKDYLNFEQNDFLAFSFNLIIQPFLKQTQ